MTPERILIIKPTALGDVATTLPLLCDLRRAYPAAKIDWLIHPAYTALIEGHDALHEAIRFDRKKLAAWWYKPSAFKLFMGLLKKLRAAKYDLVVDAQGLFRSGFLTRITGAKVRVGFANARELAPLAYTKKVRLPRDGKEMVAVDRMRALAAALGIDISRPAEFRMPVRSAVRSTGLSLPDAENDDTLKPVLPATDFVTVIPGARWNTKRWPIDRYTELVRRLLTEAHNVVLLGSPDEQPLADAIEAALEDHPPTDASATLVNLAGKTSLPEMIGVLARAALVFGNDSGPLHIAIALGRKTLSIYGPTDPHFVGPYGQLDHVLRHPVPCHPCRRKECDHHSCMKGVTVELAWEKARGRLPSPLSPPTSPQPTLPPAGSTAASR
jgi:lipopolysaccharide heptosyltransferase I